MSIYNSLILSMFFSLTHLVLDALVVCMDLLQKETV